MNSEIPLLGSAYTLGSCGIGIQRELVKALMGERDFNATLDESLDAGLLCNLLGNSIVADVLGKGGVTHKDYFGNFGQEFRSRYEKIMPEVKKIDRIILRSAIRDRLILDDTDFPKEEFSELMTMLFEKDLNTEQLTTLYESRGDKSGILINALKSDILQSLTGKYMEYESNRVIYLKHAELKPQVLGIHTEKLDLMADIFYANLEKHKAPKTSRPDDPDGKWALNWKKMCGEELPSAYELCMSAKGTASNARKYLEKFNTIKSTVNLLEKLEGYLFCGDGEFSNRSSTNVDIRPFAEKFGLDIDMVMEEVDRICGASSHHVGGHIDCTRINILPRYRADKRVIVDRDHLEGLRQILRVEYGDRRDY